MNKVKTQMRCSHLDGTLVRWEGIVLDVEIANKRNIRAELLNNYVPKLLADPIICYYGDRNEVKCGPREDCDEMRRFMIDNNGKECNLDKWNT
jgi:wolfamin